MSAPNVLSVAIIVGVIALCEGMAGALPALGSPWVPFAVVVLAAIVKGLQVYLQQSTITTHARQVSSWPRWRRWLVG